MTSPSPAVGGAHASHSAFDDWLSSMMTSRRGIARGCCQMSVWMASRRWIYRHVSLMCGWARLRQGVFGLTMVVRPWSPTERREVTPGT